MPLRKSSAVWKGTLRQGAGTMDIGQGAWQGAFSFGSRFGQEPGTNPEELIGAAHAGCFSMALAGLIDQAGFDPVEIRTTAEVTILKGDAGFRITNIELVTEADVPGIDDDTFQRLAEMAKANCPVSVAIDKKVAVGLTAKLTKEPASEADQSQRPRHTA